MTDIIDSHDAGAPTTGAPSGDGRASSGSRARSGGLNTKLMPELKQIAAGLGIKTGGMKKADLVGAIKAAQAGARPVAGPGRPAMAERPPRRPPRRRRPESRQGAAQGGAAGGAPGVAAGGSAEALPGVGRGPQGRAPATTTAPSARRASGTRATAATVPRARVAPRTGPMTGPPSAPPSAPGAPTSAPTTRRAPTAAPTAATPSGTRRPGATRTATTRRAAAATGAVVGATATAPATPAGASNRGNRNEPDTTDPRGRRPGAGRRHPRRARQLRVRPHQRLPARHRRRLRLAVHGPPATALRRGDAITGKVRQPREGERKEKFNPLVRSTPSTAPTRRPRRTGSSSRS